MHKSNFILICILVFLFVNINSQDLNEWKIKRKNIFEFTKQPSISKKDKGYFISFAVKDYCDVTIVVEDDNRKIIRHLASGVLGDNPPPPFVKKSLSQKILWDGKTDHGRYPDSLETYRIRVSLGLKANYDKTLYHSPYKRMSNNAPILCSDKDGVYTFEGLGMDYVKHFDHDGNYIKTIYPFASNKLKDIKGLETFKSHLDGKTYPKKIGFNRATLLTSGTSGLAGDYGNHYGGYAAVSMATQNGHIALAYNRINRLGTDGTTKGMDLNGPEISYKRVVKGKKVKMPVGPTSVAFSPDNKYLYMTGYVFKVHTWNFGDAYHVVKRQEYGTNKPPEIFMGKELTDSGYGSDDKSFATPTSVDVDAKGRIYVTDFCNHRVQVFNSDKKLLKSIKATYPSKVIIDKKTQEILVFSWLTIGPSRKLLKERKIDWRKIKSTITNFGTFEGIKNVKSEPLPIRGGDAGGLSDFGGQVYEVTVDSYSGKRRLWISGRTPTRSTAEIRWTGEKDAPKTDKTWLNRGIKIFEKQKGKWVEFKNMAKLAAKKVKRLTPTPFASQRLFFNPSDEHLYVGEDVGFWKSFDELVKINPQNGNVSLVKIPFDAADIVFGYKNVVYARTHYVVMRFDSRSWKEIPYDYGIEKNKIHHQTFSAPRRTVNSISAMAIPGGKPVHWQLEGMSLNFKGNLALVCYTREKKIELGRKDKYKNFAVGKEYKPNKFPGRNGHFVVHIFDKYGKVVKQDAIPGMPESDGLAIDKNNDIYVLLKRPRYISSKKVNTDHYTESLFKFSKKENRFLTGSTRATIPLDDTQKPKRDYDIKEFWVENPQWIYGGVGHGGNLGSCVCWHSRFTLDYLGRSFVPESNQFQVAVLDSNGNLIMRIGQYGNQDSAGPKSKVPLKGDGVGIFLANYVATHTDHKLFISDTGNQRILSVNLSYAKESLIKLNKNSN
ncbi:MAG: hypothetical protein COA79_23935 [Planctomycetota bacterium]|nr:MAG: hypothetical protein COA79_23935 [Planctomycetota bacterium]